jgi:hypothetical protein
MQLVAYGAQDIYLTGDPQITFFKVVYRRHTNFTMESVSQTFTGSQAFGGKSTVIVSRNGDLVTRGLLEVDVAAMTTTSSSGAGWVRELGHFLIKTVEVDIGGQQIDKHYGEWLSIWTQLTLPSSKQAGYNAMIGNTAAMTTEGSFGYSNTGADGGSATSGAYWVTGNGTPAYHLFVPLQFWFNRNPGLALPLIALQFHEVKFQFEFRPLSDLYRGAYSGTAPTLSNMELWLDYIYLDTDERRRFAKTAHEYLIEQLQFTGQETFGAGASGSDSFRLSFNHPVKFLAWVMRRPTSNDPTSYRDSLDWTDYSATAMLSGSAANNVLGVGAYAQYGDNPVSVARLVLNGHDRMTQRKGNYFRYVQPYFHFPRIPDHVINVYSFSLNPAEHQPSGTCNMSRIDNATLYITATASITTSHVIEIYAVNYNVLRITSGMGGIAFSN